MGVDAVLKGDDGGFLADHGLDLLAGAFDVPQLHAEQHDVDLAHRRGIVGGLGRHHVRLAAAALDLEPPALHGGQVRAASDEGDIDARRGERRAIAAADAAGSDNCNPHETLLDRTLDDAGYQQATAPAGEDGAVGRLETQAMIARQEMTRAVDVERAVA